MSDRVTMERAIEIVQQSEFSAPESPNAGNTKHTVCPITQTWQCPDTAIPILKEGRTAGLSSYKGPLTSPKGHT